MLIVVLAAFVAGVWAVRLYLQHSKQPDPSEIVIDEVIGMAIVWLAIPSESFLLAVFGFIAFRFFDAFKRGPVGWCDKNIKGAMGVIVDDVVAGIIAACVVWAVLFFSA